MKETTLNPIGFGMLVILSVAMFLVPRRQVSIPFLIMACFIPQGQNIVILGMSFYLLRTLTIIGMIRCLVRREYTNLKWNGMDTAVMAWSIVGTIVFAIQAGPAGLVTKFGWFCDGALGYYVFRCVIRDISDIRVVGWALSVIAVPLVVAFLIEHATAHNMFAVFGGVPAITEMREGRLRCQGAFAHSILAGCFWAAVLPMLVAEWWQPAAKRALTIVGVVCGMSLIILSASSTPIAGVGAAILGAGMFKIRNRMSLVRWLTLGLLVGLHLIMKAPVWSLVQRIDLAGGSTGSFRYRLIDAAIHRFGEWWLLGTTDTAHWGWGLQDVCIQYVLEGVRGGAASLFLFVLIFILAFRNVGRLCRGAKSASELALYWAIGVTLFVHCVNFIGVAYFGQITLLLFLHLAMAASLMSREPRRMPRSLSRRTISATRATSQSMVISAQSRRLQIYGPASKRLSKPSDTE
ncbi:MAG TPA: hypothetical protein VFE58_12900 [Tepidisphaeraceae bacterium]|nr:hypothetical protein [Tepidisphaeraceae bacterium]